MPMSVEVLEAEVLGLPVAERSRLLGRLIASIDAEVDSGAVGLVPGEEALSRLRSNLR